MSQNPTTSVEGNREADAGSQTQVASSSRSSKSSTKKPKLQTKYSDESTPLLSRDPDRDHVDDEEEFVGSDAASVVSDNRDQAQKPRSNWRTPTIISVSILTVLLIVILAFGFAVPAVADEYAQQAAVFKPQDLSIDQITSSGVVARVKGEFVLDPSRVERKSVRDLGSFGTWIAKAIEVDPSNVEVELPELGNVILGKARVPSFVVEIRPGMVNDLDFLVELEPGNLDSIRRLASDWMEGRISQLRVKGKADVGIKSGIFWLGTQSIMKEIVFEGHSLPAMPKYNITKFNIHQVDFSDGNHAIAVDTSVVLFNEYPVSFDIPPLAFSIRVPGCYPESSIHLADASTDTIHVQANHDVVVPARGIVRKLPTSLIDVCPDTVKSPLDQLLDQYMSGVETKIYVTGADQQPTGTPDWISDILRSFEIPLSITGHSFKNLIRSFSMDDVHFSLPNPLAEPGSPEANPRISAKVKVIANLPEEMNFPVSVPRLRANADVYFKNQKLGELDLHKWQDAQSKQISARNGHPPGIIITTAIKDASLNITDSDVFSDVVSAMLFGKKPVVLEVKALVDIETSTALGSLVVREIPASGEVPIKPLSDGGFEELSPKIRLLGITETKPTSFSFDMLVNITNPTNYSASVPSVKIQILVNNTLLAYANTMRHLDIGPGSNYNIPVEVQWDPVANSGEAGKETSKEFLSQYISGWNTTLTLRAYESSIPALPDLGKVLSKIPIDIPTPRLKPPKNPNSQPDPNPDPEGGGPQFIEDATMHLWTSTATFTLLSPLRNDTLFINRINATALYNHTEQVGKIIYDLPFVVPPGATTSPKLPVEWSLGSVGYNAVRDALGGVLKLDARATIGVQIGDWQQEIWFQGSGIGAHIRI